MHKILIAEDDTELRQLFAYVLTRNGYAAKGVGNGCEALEALDKEYFDLIISDIMMPVMDGYELVRQLRAAGSTTPVLMITARTTIWSSLSMSMRWCCGCRRCCAGPK